MLYLQREKYDKEYKKYKIFLTKDAKKYIYITFHVTQEDIR